MPVITPVNDRKNLCIVFVWMAVIAVIFFAFSFSFYGGSNSYYYNAVNEAHAQPYVKTIKHRDLIIDLGNGLKTNAQLTFPSVGKGPFPAVLLIPGGGAADMNYGGAFFQIAEYT